MLNHVKNRFFSGLIASLASLLVLPGIVYGVYQLIIEIHAARAVGSLHLTEEFGLGLLSVILFMVMTSGLLGINRGIRAKLPAKVSDFRTLFQAGAGISAEQGVLCVLAWFAIRSIPQIANPLFPGTGLFPQIALGGAVAIGLIANLRWWVSKPLTQYLTATGPRP